LGTNLTTSPNYIGATMPTIGGLMSYTANSFQGWTFELAINFGSTVNAVIFDLATATTNGDNIQLMLNSAGALVFNVYNSAAGSAGSAGSPFTILASVTAGTWYHLVIVVTPTSTTSWTASYVAYADGVAINGPTNALYPQSINRPNSWLGRSAATGSSYLSAAIDAFRIYPYAVPSQNVQTLWNTVYNYQGSALPTAVTRSFSAAPSSSAPVVQPTTTPNPSSTPAVLPTSTPAVLPTSTPALPVTSTPTTVPPSTSSSSSSLGTGAIVGIVVGGVVGLLLICLICYFFFCFASREKKTSTTETTNVRHNWNEMEEKAGTDDAVEMGQVESNQGEENVTAI